MGSFSRRQIDGVFLFFPEIRTLRFMQIVFLGKLRLDSTQLSLILALVIYITLRNSSKCHLLNFLSSMQSVKLRQYRCDQRSRV